MSKSETPRIDEVCKRHITETVSEGASLRLAARHMNELSDFARSLELECNRLAEEKAELVKDAERYRWIRSIVGDDEQMSALPEPKSAQHLDEIVDAKIANTHKVQP